jgi:hypothetical protein
VSGIPELEVDAVWCEARRDVGGFRKFILRGSRQ